MIRISFSSRICSDNFNPWARYHFMNEVFTDIFVTFAGLNNFFVPPTILLALTLMLFFKMFWILYYQAFLLLNSENLSRLSSENSVSLQKTAFCCVYIVGIFQKLLKPATAKNTVISPNFLM